MYVFAKLFLKNNVVSLSYRTLYFYDERINKRRIEIIIRLSQMQIFEREKVSSLVYRLIP